MTSRLDPVGVQLVAQGYNGYITALRNARRSTDDLRQATLALSRVKLPSFSSIGSGAFDALRRAARATLGVVSGAFNAMTAVVNGFSLAVSLAAAAVAAPFVLGVRPAIEFETSFANVLKTLPDSITESQVSGLRTGVRTLAIGGTPVSGLENASTALSEIAAVGARLGVPVSALEDFTRIIGELDIAVETLEAGDAAEQVAQFANAFGIDLTTSDGVRELDAFTAALVELGNTTPTTEDKILRASRRVAGLAAEYGYAAADVLAFSAATLSTGVMPEAAGSSLLRIFRVLNLASETSTGTVVNNTAEIADTQRQLEIATLRAQDAQERLNRSMETGNGVAGAQASVMRYEDEIAALNDELKLLEDTNGLTQNSLSAVARIAGLTQREFAQLYEQSPTQATVTFLAGLSALEGTPEFTSALEALQLGGIRDTQALAALAGSDVLIRALRDAANAYDNAWAGISNARQVEAERFFNTLQAQWYRLRNILTDIAITFGTAMLPVLRAVIDTLQQVLTPFANWIRAFSEANPRLMAFIGTASTLIATIGLLGRVAGLLDDAFGFGNLIGSFGIAFRLSFLQPLVALAPLAITALLGLGAALTPILSIFMRDIGGAGTALQNLIRRVGPLFSAVGDVVGDVLGIVVEFFGTLTGFSGDGSVFEALGESIASFLTGIGRSFVVLERAFSGIRPFLSLVRDAVGGSYGIGSVIDLTALEQNLGEAANAIRRSSLLSDLFGRLLNVDVLQSGELEAALNRVLYAIQSFTLGVRQAISDILTGLFTGDSSLVSSGIASLETLFAPIFSSLYGLVLSQEEPLRNTLINVLNTAFNIGKTVILTVADVLGIDTSGIEAALSTAQGALNTAISNLVSKAFGVLKGDAGLADVLAAVLRVALEGALAIFDVGAAFLDALFGGGAEGEDRSAGVSSFLEPIITEIQNFFTENEGRIAGILSASLSAALGLVETVTIVVANFLGLDTSGIAEAFDTVRAEIAGFASKIVTTVYDVFSGVDLFTALEDNFDIDLDGLRSLLGILQTIASLTFSVVSGTLDDLAASLGELAEYDLSNLIALGVALGGIAALVLGPAAVGAALLAGALLLLKGVVVISFVQILDNFLGVLRDLSDALSPFSGETLAERFDSLRDAVGGFAEALLEIPVNLAQLLLDLATSLAGVENIDVRANLEIIGSGLSDVATLLAEILTRELGAVFERLIVELRALIASVVPGVSDEIGVSTQAALVAYDTAYAAKDFGIVLDTVRVEDVSNIDIPPSITERIIIATENAIAGQPAEFYLEGVMALGRLNIDVPETMLTEAIDTALSLGEPQVVTDLLLEVGHITPTGDIQTDAAAAIDAILGSGPLERTTIQALQLAAEVVGIELDVDSAYAISAAQEALDALESGDNRVVVDAVAALNLLGVDVPSDIRDDVINALESEMQAQIAEGDLIGAVEVAATMTPTFVADADYSARLQDTFDAATFNLDDQVALEILLLAEVAGVEINPGSIEGAIDNALYFGRYEYALNFLVLAQLAGVDVDVDAILERIPDEIEQQFGGDVAIRVPVGVTIASLVSDALGNAFDFGSSPIDDPTARSGTTRNKVIVPVEPEFKLDRLDGLQETLFPEDFAVSLPVDVAEEDLLGLATVNQALLDVTLNAPLATLAIGTLSLAIGTLALLTLPPFVAQVAQVFGPGGVLTTGVMQAALTFTVFQVLATVALVTVQIAFINMVTEALAQLSSLEESILALPGTVQTALGPVAEMIADPFERGADLAIAAIERIEGAVGRLQSALVNMQSAVNAAEGSANAAAESASSAGRRGGPQFFASGGLVTQRTNAVVGESGAELILPLTNPARLTELLNGFFASRYAVNYLGGIAAASLPLAFQSGVSPYTPMASAARVGALGGQTVYNQGTTYTDASRNEVTISVQLHGEYTPQQAQSIGQSFGLGYTQGRDIARRIENDRRRAGL